MRPPALAIPLALLVLGVPDALAGTDLIPEARQVLEGYSAVLRAMPDAGRETVREWLKDWSTLKESERTELIEVLERLRYFPPSAVDQVLRDLDGRARREALVKLSKDEEYFQDQPARAMLVILGVGTPGGMPAGEEAPRRLPRLWGRLRPQGLLVDTLRVMDRDRKTPDWAAALLTGRADALGPPGGRPRYPTLGEVLRRDRSLPATGVWLIGAGGALARTDFSTAPGFGGDTTAAVHVSTDLFAYADRQRTAFVENAVKRGEKRGAAENQARNASAEQLGLDRIYPDQALRAFLWERMQRDPGGGRANTFLYTTAMRVIQRYRPDLIVLCFAEPGVELLDPPPAPRFEDARDDAEYRRNLRQWQDRMVQWRKDLDERRADDLLDLDVYLDTLYREFRRNPYYGPRGMFVVVLGDPAQGEFKLLIVSPQTPPAAETKRVYSIVNVAPTVAKFLKVALPPPVGGPVEEAFAGALATRPAARPIPPSPSTAPATRPVVVEFAP